MTARTHQVLFDSDTSNSASELLKKTAGSNADWSIRRSDLDPHVADLIETVLEAVAAGEDVSIGQVPEVVTTTTAASMLGLSRPTLMKHVREGRLPSHAVGTHTRLRRDDVMNFKRELRAVRARAIEDLMELEDELGEPL